MEKARGLRLAGRAGAQLILIVVGVTLALWADAWVTSRMDREIESARLESLDENVGPFLIRHVDLSLLLPELLLAQPADENASDVRTAGAYEELVSLQEFRNLAVFKLDLMEQLARVSSELEDALVRVQEAVALRREALR